MSDIQELEAQIQNHESLVAQRKLALKLSENPAFRKLFHEDYFTREAARLVQLSSDPSLTPAQRADALSMAQATGHTRRYMSMLIQMGAVAERELPTLHAELEELRAEELRGDSDND